MSPPPKKRLQTGATLRRYFSEPRGRSNAAELENIFNIASYLVNVMGIKVLHPEEKFSRVSRSISTRHSVPTGSTKVGCGTPELRPLPAWRHPRGRHITGGQGTEMSKPPFLLPPPPPPRQDARCEMRVTDEGNCLLQACSLRGGGSSGGADPRNHPQSLTTKSHINSLVSWVIHFIYF